MIPCAKPFRWPTQWRGFSTGWRSTTFTFRPTKRSNSPGFLSFRSSPGELTSSVYPAPGTTSSTSRIVPTFCEIYSQSACVTPAGLSIKIRKTRRLPAPTNSTSTTSRPTSPATRSAICCTLSTIDARSVMVFSSRAIKKWAFAHSVSSPPAPSIAPAAEDSGLLVAVGAISRLQPPAQRHFGAHLGIHQSVDLFVEIAVILGDLDHPVHSGLDQRLHPLHLAVQPVHAGIGAIHAGLGAVHAGIGAPFGVAHDGGGLLQRVPDALELAVKIPHRPENTMINSTLNAHPRGHSRDLRLRHDRRHARHHPARSFGAIYAHPEAERRDCRDAGAGAHRRLGRCGPADRSRRKESRPDPGPRARHHCAISASEIGRLREHHFLSLPARPGRRDHRHRRQRSGRRRGRIASRHHAQLSEPVLWARRAAHAISFRESPEAKLFPALLHGRDLRRDRARRTDRHADAAPVRRQLRLCEYRSRSRPARAFSPGADAVSLRRLRSRRLELAGAASDRAGRAGIEGPQYSVARLRARPVDRTPGRFSNPSLRLARKCDSRRRRSDGGHHFLDAARRPFRRNRRVSGRNRHGPDVPDGSCHGGRSFPHLHRNRAGIRDQLRLAWPGDQLARYRIDRRRRP